MRIPVNTSRSTFRTIKSPLHSILVKERVWADAGLLTALIATPAGTDYRFTMFHQLSDALPLTFENHPRSIERSTSIKMEPSDSFGSLSGTRSRNQIAFGGMQ